MSVVLSGIEYQITECKTGKPVREIHEGDELISFRGESWTFLRLTRGPEYNGTSKVYAQLNDGSDWKQECYAQVFDLIVEPLS